MAEIIGTIVTIQDFLSSAPKSVTIRGKEEVVFELPEGRKYVIPAFQREIRWSKENLNTLVQDIKDSNKFLGNVILAASDKNEFFIIDGQQRISVLLMLIFYLNKKWGDKIQAARDFKACTLSIESFSAYEALQEKEYDAALLTDQERETDHYKQSVRYKELWDFFAEIKELQTVVDVRNFLTNMVRSTLNVILAERDNTNYNIDYFIDVNLKGVRLDTEDIFKGYLFHMNNSPNTLKTG